MTQSETKEPTPTSTSEAGEAPPEPAPWTPELASEWNAYYDLFVLIFVAGLAFFASANYITHSSIWNQLQVGRQIIASGRPVTTDTLSYTKFGQPWVNIPWLVDVVHAQVYRMAGSLVSTDPTDPVGSAQRADQYGAYALVGLDAFLRMLAAIFLMQIRRAGPGLWWTAVCTVLAFGAMVNPHPLGLMLGGICGPGQVTPGNWGVFLLVIELWLIHKAVTRGQLGAAWTLPILFAVWANVDESFLVGLLILAAVTIGRLRPAREEGPGTFNLNRALIALGLSIAACLLNPSHVKVFGAAVGPVLSLFASSTDVPLADQLSYFGKGIREVPEFAGAWEMLIAFYVIVVAVGYLSFALNYRRFSLGRFLVYTVAVILWGAFIRFSPEFGVVFAATLAMNGQEWYHDQFGRQGRTELGWQAWSVGGRLVTLSLIFVFVMAKGLTGYLAVRGEPQFGFGYLPDEFAFEAADLLKTAPLTGNVLNTTASQGDALIWRAPSRKTYTDSRPHLFDQSLINDRQAVRRALVYDSQSIWDTFSLTLQSGSNAAELPKEGQNRVILANAGSALHIRAFDAEGRTFIDTDESKLTGVSDRLASLKKRLEPLWPPHVLTGEEKRGVLAAVREIVGPRPFLDRFKISAVMVDPSTQQRTYDTLFLSKQWIPFHDDGNIVLFGRSDADPSEVAYFEANRLDADAMVYRRAKPAPPPERPPTAVTAMDSVYRWRTLARPQPHTLAAGRWLDPVTSSTGIRVFPDPAHCYLAIREARTALAARPDDTQAFRILAAAYRSLMVSETALLQGIQPVAANGALLNQITPRSDLLAMRFRQRAAALNYAILTTPKPSTREGRRDLQMQHLELSQLFGMRNMVDLARDHLQAALEGAQEGDFTAEGRAELSQTLAQFNERVKSVQEQMNSLMVERQLGAVQLAGVAINQGMPGLAIHELEEANRSATNPGLVKPQLLDLYCDTGQPDKAVDMLGSGVADDPDFGTEPGVSAMRHGLAYFLLGNSEYAGNLWSDSVTRLRFDRVSRALSGIQGVIRGEPKAAAYVLLEVPEKLNLQAIWEYDTALCRLEGGAPEDAAVHFTKLLTLVPKFNLRPIVAYYLEKLGKPVPPESNAAETKPGASTVSPAPTPAKPAEATKPSAPPAPADVPRSKEATPKAP